ARISGLSAASAELAEANRPAIANAENKDRPAPTRRFEMLRVHIRRPPPSPHPSSRNQSTGSSRMMEPPGARFVMKHNGKHATAHGRPAGKGERPRARRPGPPAPALKARPEERRPPDRGGRMHNAPVPTLGSHAARKRRYAACPGPKLGGARRAVARPAERRC